MAVWRYDRGGELRKPVRHDNGWVRVDGYLTRTGVFTYRLPNGTERRELRLDSEVFHPEAMASFENVPVTDSHPPEHLDARNTKQYAVGNVGNGLRREGDFVAGHLMVFDAEATAKLEARTSCELSCGYTCDLEASAGVHNGETYTHVQRNIRGNHVALVPRGRAGADVRVRMDAQDAVQVDGGAPPPPGGSAPPPLKETPAMAKINHDGVDYECTEQMAQLVSRLQRQVNDATEASAKAGADVKAELTKALARADAADGALAKLKKEHDDAVDPKALAARVDARVSLIQAAAPHLDEADVKGLPAKSDKDIKLAVLARLAPEFKADGKSDEYVSARFDAELAHADATGVATAHNDLADVATAALTTSRKGEGKRADADDAYARMVERNRNAWKGKDA